jgi:hypothetical protein
MVFKGTFFRMTDLPGFLKGIITNPGQPLPATTFPEIQVELHFRSFVAAPLQLPSFLTLRTTTAGDGTFAIDIPPDLAGPETVARVVAFHELLVPRSGTPAVLPSGPLYRSAGFSPANVGSRQVNIFVAFLPDFIAVPPITFERVRAEAAAFRQRLGLDRLDAVVQSDRVAVAGARGGFSFSLDLFLSPSISPDLNEFVSHQVRNFFINEDFFTSLCVSKEKLQQQIQEGMNAVTAELNSQIKNGLEAAAAQEGLPAGVVANFFDQKLTLTIDMVSFPLERVDHTPAGFPVDIHEIALSPWLGFPRHV